TVDGTPHALGPLFTVFATQNPVEYEGTYPLPEAQLDRFLVKLRVPYPSLDAELRMLALHEQGAGDMGDGAPELEPVVDTPTLHALRSAPDAVRVAPEVQRYVADIVRATREDNAFTLGGSPRASVALLRMARAVAVMAGRDFATPDDVKGLAPAVLR